MEVLKGEGILEKLREVFSRAREHLRICSPWIKGDVLKDLFSLLAEGVDLQVVVRASSFEDMRITDPEVFRIVRERGGKVFLSPRLHAKFVLSDHREAVVGSANLTHGGFFENLETALYVQDPEKVEELERFFEEIKRESYDFSRTIAFVVDLENAREGKVLLLKEVEEQTYVKIPLEGENFLLGRIFDVKSVNPSIGIDIEDLSSSKVLGEVLSQKDEDWRIASLFGKFMEGTKVMVARLEVLGEYEKERNLFKTPVRPVSAGWPVETLEAEGSLRAVLLKNHSGYDMRFPTYLGRLQGTQVKAYLDMDKVISTHMVVMGTTGSGKTTFVKKILKNFKEPVRVFVFDIYGEYYEDLREKGNVERVPIPNVLLPVDGEDLRRLLKESGLSIGERSSEERELMAFLRRHLKPELHRTVLAQKSLETLLSEASSVVKDGLLRDSLLEVLEFWKRTFGEESVRGQPELLELLKRSLRGEGGVVVYDYRDTDIAETRINVAGLVMRELLRIARSDRRDRIIVLEEAHNFAPERGAFDVQAGTENLAYIGTRRIAMEGRKLRLGLIAVTQRPANISKFILSQLNTQVVFKLITKNDLEAVSTFFEQSREDVFRLLPFLKPGTAYISGLAVPFSFLFQMEEIPGI